MKNSTVEILKNEWKMAANLRRGAQRKWEKYSVCLCPNTPLFCAVNTNIFCQLLVNSLFAVRFIPVLLFLAFLII